MPQDLGTALSHGLSIYTAGGSAVSAYGPIIGRTVSVVALTVPHILNDMSIDTSFTVTGAAVGDPVIVGYPSAVSASLVANAFVSAANEVTLRLSTSDATAIQTAQDWGFTLIRRSFITSIR